MMDLQGRSVIVTGGASGIGRALCRAFAEAGARGVVVADVDGPGAQAVAGELEGGGVPSVAHPTDVGDPAAVAGLVALAEDRFGPVDVFCANAGVGIFGGIELPDEDWDRLWRVNVLAHLYAARAVLPQMVARGEGCLVHTASAAGLLTELASAPYAVTKHAVVALAEWLAITYGDAGIQVACLCPQGVRTKMTAGMLADDASPSASLTSPVTRDGMLEPEVVAAAVIEAVTTGRFLVLPHPEVAVYEQRRAADRDRWLAGMRRVRAAFASRPRNGTR